MKIVRGGFKYKSLHDKQNGIKLFEEFINSDSSRNNTAKVGIQKCRKGCCCLNFVLREDT